jgi:alcohol dehydrogenase class IV
LVDRLNIPPLRTYGLAQADIPEVVEKSGHSSSMRGNPVQLSPNELAEILLQAV